MKWKSTRGREFRRGYLNLNRPVSPPYPRFFHGDFYAGFYVGFYVDFSVETYVESFGEYARKPAYRLHRSKRYATGGNTGRGYHRGTCPFLGIRFATRTRVSSSRHNRPTSRPRHRKSSRIFPSSLDNRLPMSTLYLPVSPDLCQPNRPLNTSPAPACRVPYGPHNGCDGANPSESIPISVHRVPNGP